MTDWVVPSVFFCPKTAQKLPEIEQNYPNTTLKISPNPPKISTNELHYFPISGLFLASY